MNEKLKKILDALYRNSNDFQQACEKELCDPRIPSTPTHFVYYLTNGFTPESRYYALLKDNFLKTTQGVMDKKTEEEINELVAKFSSSSTFEDVKDFFKEEIKNWDKETQDKFLDNFDKVVKGKKYDGSFFIPIITTCVVTLAKSEKIDNLDEFYDTTTKLILASKPKTLSKNYIKKLVLEKIEAAFGKESSEYAETLTIINNAKKKEQLSSNSSEPSCFTSSEYRPLRYYQNGEPVYLIQNEKLLDLTTSIEDAIKTFDLNDNSNLLKFALEKIDDEVRKYFKDKGIDLKYAIPATEAVFLTLCYQLGKEVDDNVLFAISDPLSDMLSYSPFNEEILTAIKDICKEISGKEVEFEEEPAPIADNIAKPIDDITKPVDGIAKPVDGIAKPVDDIAKPKDDIAKPIDDITKPKDDITKPVDDITKPVDDENEPPLIEDVGEIPPVDSSDARGHERTIEDVVKKLKKSFLKIENLKTKRSIAPAIKNAKQKIAGLHYRFVGEPEFGKNKRLPKHVSEKERDFIGNFNLGKGKANTIASKIIATLTTIYQTQLRRIKDTIDDLKARARAGEKIGEKEIENLNKAIEDYNASTNPKALLRTFSRMFISALKETNLVTEEYEKAFEEKHPELKTNTEEPEII